MKKRITIELAVLFSLFALIATGQVDVYPGGLPPFDDAGGLVKGSSDVTKQVRIEADTNVPTGTTVVLTAPAASVTLAGLPTAALTASRLAVIDSNSRLAVNGALTTNCVPKSASSGATLSCSQLSDNGTILSIDAASVGVTGSAPSCSDSVLTAAIDGTSTDFVSTCNLTGTGSTSTATVTLTFAASKTTAPVCTCNPTKGTSGANDSSWSSGSTCAQTAYSTTAPTFVWLNATGAAAVNLTSGSKFGLTIVCYERS